MNFLFKYRTASIAAIFVLLLIPVGQLFSQPNKIMKGVVLDIETSEPIPTVHVYISQTTIGTTTKHDGTFEFSTSLSGVHTLVFSYVGYKTEIEEINFYAEKNPYFEVKLTPDSIELGEVEITASNKEWQENFEIFRNNFIGMTGAAEYTEIENPWVIGFDIDEDENLIASASRPLTIYNYALGYEMHVDLVDFMWPKSGELGYYLFHVSYKEIESESNRQLSRWERNRRNTYLGSFEHFLESLYADNTKDNDFDVVIPNTHDGIDLKPMESVSLSGLRSHANVSGLTIEDINVYRLRYPVDVLYGRRCFNKDRARSRITPTARGGIFVVTDQARLLNPVSLRVDGVWSTHRLANLLPENYELP